MPDRVFAKWSSTALATLSLVIGPGAKAQDSLATGAISGTVTDSMGRALSDVTIIIDGGVKSTRSLERGWYRFDSVAQGPHLLIARRLGYRPIVLPIGVLSNDITFADLVFRAQPPTLSTITVNGSTFTAPRWTGFDARMRTGSGAYFTSDDINKLKPMRISTLLRRIPTLRVEPNGEIFSKRGSVSILSKACANGLPLFVDNALVGGGSIEDVSMLTKGSHHNPTSTSQAPIDLISPSEVAGIEVYSGPATVPANLPGANSSCGAILIWTKQ